jgi:hypothetical protein
MADQHPLPERMTLAVSAVLIIADAEAFMRKTPYFPAITSQQSGLAMAAWRPPMDFRANHLAAA